MHRSVDRRGRKAVVAHESPSQPDDVVLSLVGRPAVPEEHQGRRVGRSLRHPHQTRDPSGGPHHVESALGDALHRQPVSYPVEAHLSETIPRTPTRAVNRRNSTTASSCVPERRPRMPPESVPQRRVGARYRFVRSGDDPRRLRVGRTPTARAPERSPVDYRRGTRSA